MKALDRKLIRDLAALKGQILAIGLVMGCGVASFIMSLNTLASLTWSQSHYYETYRFADVFANLKRAPRALEPRLASIPGVANVQTRVVEEVNLDIPGMDEPAVGRLISIPERSRPKLNAVHLRRGRYIEPGRPGEILASEAFAEAHGLDPGDTITAILNGSKESFTIVGIAISPEYIYEVKPGDLFPDNRHFGVLWMAYEELASAFNMEGGFNNAAATLLPGASEEEIIRRLDLLLKPYGGLESYGREDQLSHRFLSDEIRGLRGTGWVVPAIFIGVAGFLLNVVMSRMIQTQREQIAALKAFGYRNGEVGVHYLKFALLTAVFGAVIGVAAGVRLGIMVTALYAEFYRFPVFEFTLDPRVFIGAVLVSCGAAGLSVIGAVLKAVRLPPAEAMRPEPPPTFKPTLLERVGFQKWLSQPARIILRQVERRPLKALISCMGIAMAAALLVLGNSMGDAIDYMIRYQFIWTQRQDITVAFVEPREVSVIHEVRQMPGVMDAEPFRSVPVRMVAGHHRKRLAITGLPPGASLNRLLDESGNRVAIPKEGLLLSKKLGELLKIKPGDRVTVEVLEGKRPVVEVLVSGLVKGYTGITAYMDLETLNDLMREGPVVSGAQLMTDRRDQSTLYRRLKETPAVAGVTIKEKALESFNQTIVENMTRMNVFNLVFACVIACGVIYNIARVSLSERTRELATLRVIGFTRLEISTILLGELALITLVAIPIGLVIGYGLAWMITRFYDTELYRIPFFVEPASYGYAVLVVIGATLLSALAVRRRLDHLDLVSVLKSRD